MGEKLWAKMPCSWQTDPSHHQRIGASDRGEAIAALKLYVALCLKANYGPRSSLPETGCVQKSLTQLGELSGLSRPMVVRGLRQLRAWKVIDSIGGRPATYHITDYETASYWTKLPRTHLYGSAKETRLGGIASMSNRTATTLHALQLYVYLASIRDKISNKAKVTYDRLTELLGIDRNEMSKAISVLVGHDLLSVRLGKTDEFSTTEYPSNVYWLRGSTTDEDSDRTSPEQAHEDFAQA